MLQKILEILSQSMFNHKKKLKNINSINKKVYWKNKLFLFFLQKLLAFIEQMFYNSIINKRSVCLL